LRARQRGRVGLEDGYGVRLGERAVSGECVVGHISVVEDAPVDASRAAW